MADLVKVARAGEIAPGEAKAVETGGKKIAIFNIEGTFYAIDDTCTHRGGPLSEGMVVGTEVTCPWHGAIFDVTSGGVLSPPAPKDVTKYAVRVAPRAPGAPRPSPRFSPLSRLRSRIGLKTLLSTFPPTFPGAPSFRSASSVCFRCPGRSG
jgi:nitrite reductase/ring-hydroxylating ferredoxin subunit